MLQPIEKIKPHSCHSQLPGKGISVCFPLLDLLVGEAAGQISSHRMEHSWGPSHDGLPAKGSHCESMGHGKGGCSAAGRSPSPILNNPVNIKQWLDSPVLGKVPVPNQLHGESALQPLWGSKSSCRSHSPLYTAVRGSDDTVIKSTEGMKPCMMGGGYLPHGTGASAVVRESLCLARGSMCFLPAHSKSGMRGGRQAMHDLTRFRNNFPCGPYTLSALEEPAAWWITYQSPGTAL